MGIFCLFYQPKLAALASQELPDALAERVERHLRTCPDCLSEWALQQRMTESLRSAAPAALAPSPSLWENLEAAIRAESPTPTPALPTKRPPVRRLAPLGGLALAGMAMAAVVVTRPSREPLPIPAPQATPATEAIKVAELPKPSPTPQPLTAVKLAQDSEKIEAPQPVTDPFEKKSIKTPSKRPMPLPRVAQVAPRRKRLPEPTDEEPWVVPTRQHGVAVIEVGMNRVVEDSQTAEFNRMVSEAEQKETGVSTRASCAPTEALATASAQNTRGLFQ